MKKVLMNGFLAIGLTGCSVVDDIQDYYTEEKAEDAFKELCSREELVICGNEVFISPDSNATIPDIIENTLEFFNEGVTYLYEDDNVQYGRDYYAYMYFRDNGIRYGDCEDFTITFLEDNIRNGNIQKGEAEWVIGEYGGETHAWSVITKDEEVYLFDNIFPQGILISKAYTDEPYEEMAVIYRY